MADIKHLQAKHLQDIETKIKEKLFLNFNAVEVGVKRKDEYLKDFKNCIQRRCTLACRHYDVCNVD